MKKIVMVDQSFDDLSICRNIIESAGMEFAVFNDTSEEGILKNAADADGVITSYGKFTKRVIDGLPKCKVISRTGVGVDNVDVAEATARGIAVCNVPGYATDVVSDHAITLALSVLRRINELDANLRKGIWDYSALRPLGEVYGLTFGVVGMGHIGRAVAEKARGLGFHVICCSHSLVPGNHTPEGFEIYSYEDVLRQADVVSFHVELLPDTRHMLNTQNIGLLKQDAIVVNTARGAVIDTRALAEALTAGKLFGAGIDVFEEEPIAPDDPLLQAPHTVLTPHCAFWSEKAGAELERRSAQAPVDVLQGKIPRDCLNPQVLG